MSSTRKEAVEIHCRRCSTGFRLWIPAERMPEWEKGSTVSCVVCGARQTVRRGTGGFEASPLEEASVKASEAPKAAPAPPAVEPAPQAEEAAPEGADLVLFVEDDRLARQMAENALQGLDIRLVPVKNSTEALKAVKKGGVKLIVTDLYLKNLADPESLIDGEELLQKIAGMGLNIPAIITTGKDIIDDLVLDPKWFDLHVKGFIQKGNPFWAEELKLKINEVLYKG